MVHHAAQANRLTLIAKRLTMAAALAAAIVAAGCGGESNPGDRGVGNDTALQLANCDDWNSSGTEERLVTVERLRALNEGSSEEFRGKVLDDDQGYDVLEAQCEPEFAGAFKLYKLYGRAAAFAGH